MLVVAGTPLGNPQDASPRLRAALADADIVAAEDTRRLRRLAADLDVTLSGQVVSNWQAVERNRLAPLLEALRAGSTVVLVSDGGMPVVSDPGYLLVRAAAAEGLPVSVIPGPSAVTAALAVSGLPADRFCFEGFLARKASARRTALAALVAEARTMVFFESPRRLAGTLADMREAFGREREAVVCRELTKTYEQVVRGTLSVLADWASVEEVRGEVTLVVAGASTEGRGASGDDPTDLGPAVAEVGRRVAGGVRLSEAVADVSAERGVPRRALYQASLRERG